MSKKSEKREAEATSTTTGKPGKLKAKAYEKALRKLQVELTKLQERVRRAGLKVCVMFEGREGAEKRGTIEDGRKRWKRSPMELQSY